MSTGKSKKVIGLMKDELGGKIMTEFAALRPKTYFYLMEDGKNHTHVTKKKAKGTKKSVIKRVRKINDYQDCLFNNKMILRQQQIFKSEAHNIYTEEVKNITLSSNDDKRLLGNDGTKITTYPYGTSARQVCKTVKNC